MASAISRPPIAGAVGHRRTPSPTPRAAARVAVRSPPGRRTPARSPSPGVATGRPLAAAYSCSAAARERYQVFYQIQRAGGEDALPHPLDDITTLELEETRKLARPPESVRRVMECVHLILSETPVSLRDPPAWEDALRTCVRADFLTRVRRFDVTELLEKPALVDHLCRSYFLDNGGFPPLRTAMVRHGSRAVVAFFGWTVAVIADILPAWGVEEVGGEAARRAIEELESERVQLARRLQAQREAEAKRRDEAAKAPQRCEIATQTTPRPADSQEENMREQAQAHANEEVLEAERHAELQRYEFEAQQKEMEIQRLKEATELERLKKKERNLTESDEEESHDENEDKDLCIWDVSGNPDRRFLEGDDSYVVRFPSDAKTNFVTVMTKTPFRKGLHFFEFAMHRIGDEQWCGITDENFQAGSRVSGRNISAWSYYCGRRDVSKPRDQAALHIDKKVMQEFSHVSSGDTIGLVVDASKRAVAFLWNGQLQGVCPLAKINRQPLYVFTHLDAAGDCVELRELPLAQVPQVALDAIEVVAGAKLNQEVML